MKLEDIKYVGLMAIIVPTFPISLVGLLFVEFFIENRYNSILYPPWKRREIIKKQEIMTKNILDRWTFQTGTKQTLPSANCA